MHDYVPGTQEALCAWVRSFATQVAADPTSFGVAPAEVQAIGEAVGAFLAAVAETKEPGSRTRPSLVRRETARKAMLPLLRRVAQQIKNNPAVSEAAKSSLALSRREKARRSLPLPTTHPYVHVLGVERCRHCLYIGSQEDTPGPGRPRDVAGAQIFCHLGETPPADPLEARFVRFTTRKRCTVSFKPEQVGQRAHYFARWQTATGETGPWGGGTSMTVAG